MISYTNRYDIRYTDIYDIRYTDIYDIRYTDIYEIRYTDRNVIRYTGIYKQNDMTSYLNIKLKSDTYAGMKLETYDYQICYSTICVLIPDLKHCL